ncbi:MAG: ferritin family protein [Candidatus Margulisbacteria bacterium]|nr:ferritin family protein [Candidatus Margulisiibacteriota bacterium]
MNIIDQAIQMEIEGEQFYRAIAAETTDASVKIILNKLADDEFKHRLLFEKMKENLPALLVPSDVMDATLNFFQELQTQNKIAAFKESITQALEKAEDIEIKSYHLYRQHAAHIKNPGYREVVSEIAAEEEKHASIVLDLIIYYTNPRQWVESAEWYHQDAY